MDPLLDAAQKKRAELVKELEKIDHFLETYRSLWLELEMESANKGRTHDARNSTLNPVDGERKEADREADAPDDATPKRVRVTDNPKPADVVAAAVEVIREAGRPLTRRKIWKALAARDLEVRGADPIKALGTMLWRSGKDQLVQIEGHGYGLKGVDYDLDGLFPPKPAE